MTARIVIVGAGYCGTTTAIRLASSDLAGVDLSITLIDEPRRFARGVAYQANDEGWLLNARAPQLSAVDGRPDEFAAFCQALGCHQAESGFAPRSLYGAYLESLFERTVAASRHRLRRREGKVVALERLPEGGVQVRLASGTAIPADHVVLATGPVSAEPLGNPDLQALGTHYLHDPWAVQSLHDARPGSTFFVLGTGLTALDVVVSLQRHVPGARFRMVSRRGLLPRPHAPAVPADDALREALRACVCDSVGASLRSIRRLAREHMGQGGDWRSMMDVLRALAPEVWTSWSAREQARFVEHVAPYWDAHRHRCPPQTAELLENLQMAWRLEVHAARLEQVRREAGRLRIDIRHRHSGQRESVQADYLVNCTGATGAVYRDRLYAQMMEAGLASCDAMGLRVDAAYRLVGPDGASVPCVSYVGPLLKAKYWEATAIPELRQHIGKLVAGVLASLEVPQASVA